MTDRYKWMGGKWEFVTGNEWAAFGEILVCGPSETLGEMRQLKVDNERLRSEIEALEVAAFSLQTENEKLKQELVHLRKLEAARTNWLAEEPTFLDVSLPQHDQK